MLDGLKILQLATETDPTGQFVATATAGANKKMDLGAAIDAKLAAAFAGTITLGTLRTDNFRDATGVEIATVSAGVLGFAMPVEFTYLTLNGPVDPATAPNHSLFRDQNRFNLATYKGDSGNFSVIENSSEYEDIVATAASDQTGITTATKLTNNGLGADTYTAQLRNYTYLWDRANNRIRANSNFKVGDLVELDFGCVVNCASPNTVVQVLLRGYDSLGSLIFTKTIISEPIKNSGTDVGLSRTTFVFVGPTIGDDGYFELYGTADGSTAFKNKSFVVNYKRVAK